MKIYTTELHKEKVTMNAHTPEETAAILGVTTRTLAAWRKAETGPEYVRVGNAIRYPHEALIDWLSANITLPKESPLARARTAQTLDQLRGSAEPEPEPEPADAAKWWASLGQQITQLETQKENT